jgi:hypothetical protein
MQVGCCCPLPSAGCCVYCCAGFVQHVTAARQVQPGLFDRLDISTDTQMSTDMPSRVGHAGRMLLSSAICRLLCFILCTGDRHPNRCTDVYCHPRCGHCQSMRLSAALQVVVACCRFCATCQHSGYRAARSASPIQHQNNRAGELCCCELILCRCCCLRAVLF